MHGLGVSRYWAGWFPVPHRFGVGCALEIACFKILVSRLTRKKNAVAYMTSHFKNVAYLVWRKKKRLTLFFCTCENQWKK